MSDNTINRDTKHKGPRLQRLRVLSLILDKAKEGNRAIHIFFGIEYQGDVYTSTQSRKGEQTYHEEDKNYDEDSSFTMNSPEIRKALVGFLDTWFKKNLSPNCNFAFYSTNDITKERETNRSKELSIKYPAVPLLEVIKNKSWDNSILKIISDIIIDAYKEQYRNKEGNGNLASIEQFELIDWEDFLNQTIFAFGQPDEDELNQIVLEKIQSCPFYNSSHIGKEETLKSCLLDKIDEFHLSEDPTENLIIMSQVELIFKEVSGLEKEKAVDRIYKMWDELEATLDDTRNIRDKILDVTSRVSEEKIRIYSRIASTGLHDKKENDSIKDFHSLRYRIWLRCVEEIREFKSTHSVTELNEEILDNLHSYLVDEANRLADDLRQDYNYRFKSTNMIKGIIYQLIDECFLSYDEFG